VSQTKPPNPRPELQGKQPSASVPVPPPEEPEKCNEGALMAEDNDKGAPMAEDNDRGVPIEEDNDKGAPMVEDNDEGAPVVEDNNKGAPRAEEGGKDVPMEVDEEINVSPMATGLVLTDS